LNKPINLSIQNHYLLFLKIFFIKLHWELFFLLNYTNDLENVDAVAAPINDYLWVLALAGLFFIFLKLQVAQNKEMDQHKKFDSLKMWKMKAHKKEESIVLEILRHTLHNFNSNLIKN